MIEKVKQLFGTDKAKLYTFYIMTTLAPLMLCAGLAVSVYLGDRSYASVLQWSLCILASVMIFFGIIRRPVNSDAAISPLAAAITLTVSAYLIPDLVMGSHFPKSSIFYILMGLLLCAFFYLLAIAVPINPKILLIVFNVFFTFFAIMQYYIVQFRGNPIQFSDLQNISSGLEIQDEYSFSPQTMPVFALINCVTTSAVVILTKFEKPTNKKRIILGATSVACLLCVILTGHYCYDLGIRNRYIRLGFSGGEVTDSYRQVGFDLMFCYDALYNHVEIPEGYTKEKGKAFVEIKEEPEQVKDAPVIIGILNESFADFHHIGDFRTNMDYMPNYRSLKDEAVTGFTAVSAYGGYSCNSEYEFLTGNTMAFLPPGSAAFTQYLDNKQWGLVTWLKELGYVTKTVSPCSEGLWSIGTAYENLQFDDREYECENSMNEKHNVNGELSDSSLYKYLEEQFERRDPTKPLFLWTATMQNHGPYNDMGLVDKQITFEDYNNDEALQYLNSIYSSDQALGELLDYFRNKDQEVIIVFFGDHFPHILSFTEYLYGSKVENLDVEEYSRLRQTPFFIWSNKGTEAREIDYISLNYLSNELMDVAGLPKAPYQQELDKVREKIPSISSFGYRTDDGKWHESTETAEGYEDILNDYKTMQYYRIFDQYKDN